MAALEEAIKAVKNCCGVTSIDISPILADPGLFAQACEDIYQMYEREVFDIIITTKLSGTVFAAALARRMGKGLIITTCVKPTDGYLTEEIEGNSSSFSVGMPEGFIGKGTKAVVVVDQISHGRDIKAAINMVEKQGGTVIKVSGFVEVSEINARKKAIKGYPVESRLFTEDF